MVSPDPTAPMSYMVAPVGRAKKAILFVDMEDGIHAQWQLDNLDIDQEAWYAIDGSAVLAKPKHVTSRLTFHGIVNSGQMWRD